MFSRDSSGASPLRIARRCEGKRKKWEKKEGEGGKEKRRAAMYAIRRAPTTREGERERERGQVKKKAVRITAAPMR